MSSNSVPPTRIGTGNVPRRISFWRPVLLATALLAPSAGEENGSVGDVAKAFASPEGWKISKNHGTSASAHLCDSKVVEACRRNGVEALCVRPAKWHALEEGKSSEIYRVVEVPRSLRLRFTVEEDQPGGARPSHFILSGNDGEGRATSVRLPKDPAHPLRDVEIVLLTDKPVQVNLIFQLVSCQSTLWVYGVSAEPYDPSRLNQDRGGREAPLIADLRSHETKGTQALTRSFFDETGWELKPVKGALVLSESQPPEYCDAKTVSLRKSASLPNGELFISFVGKSSHLCDGDCQVSNVLEIPCTSILFFRLANGHAWDKNGQVGLRITDPEGERVFLSQRIESGGHDLEEYRGRSILFITDKPTKVRIVFDTTCRGILRIPNAGAWTIDRPVLDQTTVETVDALIKKLSHQTLAIREEASESLRRLASPPGEVNYGIWLRLHAALQSAKDVETRTRLTTLVEEPAVGVADLRTTP